jgi:hypothetical protein
MRSRRRVNVTWTVETDEGLKDLRVTADVIRDDTAQSGVIIDNVKGIDYDKMPSKERDALEAAFIEEVDAAEWDDAQGGDPRDWADDYY